MLKAVFLRSAAIKEGQTTLISIKVQNGLHVVFHQLHISFHNSFFITLTSSFVGSEIHRFWQNKLLSSFLGNIEWNHSHIIHQ